MKARCHPRPRYWRQFPSKASQALADQAAFSLDSAAGYSRDICGSGGLCDHAPFRPPDTEGDGLADAVEEPGWRTPDDREYRTDPTHADTDADGLTDGDEAGAVVTSASAQPVYAGISDPPTATTTDSATGPKSKAGRLRGRGLPQLGRPDVETVVARPSDPSSPRHWLRHGRRSGSYRVVPGPARLVDLLARPTIGKTQGCANGQSTISGSPTSHPSSSGAGLDLWYSTSTPTVAMQTSV